MHILWVRRGLELIDQGRSGGGAGAAFEG